jgi:hypothetical protein
VQANKERRQAIHLEVEPEYLTADCNASSRSWPLVSHIPPWRVAARCQPPGTMGLTAVVTEDVW